MQVCLWGTRGSLPASLQAESIRQRVRYALEIAAQKSLESGSDIEAFIDRELPFWAKGTYGTNTSCVEIRDGEDFVLCDAGSGIRDFGNHLIRTSGEAAPRDFHIFISHLHWDHIQGFPFFVPAYSRGNRITFYGCHENMVEAFSVQHRSPFFPVEFEDLEAEIRFDILVPNETYEIAGFRVNAMEQCHPGKSYGYRFERNEKAVVFSTDSEHECEGDEESLDPFVAFFKKADLLIFDAQYTFSEACTIKEDWGHSSNLIGVDLAKKARVKHLCLFHQETASSDEDLDNFLMDTKKLASQMMEERRLQVSIAHDGMVVEI
jgi:phosphoribosyl 1,2-cyclic phosphodiesterase